MYNEYIAAVKSILDSNKEKWGMKQPWADFDDPLVPSLPAGSILFVGDDREWVSFPRVLEHRLTCQICYYYEQVEQQVNERKLRENVESIAKLLTEYFVLDNPDLGGEIVGSGLNVRLREMGVAGNFVLTGIINHYCLVRETIVFRDI
jgi:hypothetical protein